MEMLEDNSENSKGFKLKNMGQLVLGLSRHILSPSQGLMAKRNDERQTLKWNTNWGNLWGADQWENFWRIDIHEKLVLFLVYLHLIQLRTISNHHKNHGLEQHINQVTVTHILQTSEKK